MALSSVSYLGDGVNSTFAVTFPYLAKNHVIVTINNIEDTSITWLTSSSIVTTSVPSSGSVIKIKRNTPTSPIVSFKDGSTVTENILSTATLQPLYVSEESKDVNLESNNQVALNAAIEAKSAASEAIATVADKASISAVSLKANTSDLAASTGVSLIGCIKNATGAVYTTLSKWLGWQDLSVFDFMNDAQIYDVKMGTLLYNVTEPVQSAILAAAASGRILKIPDGKYHITSPLNIPESLTIRGTGASPYRFNIGLKGSGSWFYLNHLGKGFNIANSSGVISGVSLEKFGTFRNQPAPYSGWIPLDCDFDVDISNADVLVDDLLLLNPSKGIRLTNGNAGRLEINRLRGQAMKVLVDIDTSYDLCKLNNIHQWPFWKDDNYIHTYTEQNLDVVYSKRNDNPFIVNIFSIFARAGIRFGQNINGGTSKVHLVNGDFDRGLFGVYVDSTVTTGVTGQLLNVSHQGESGLASSKAVFIQGNNSTLDIENLTSNICNQNSIRVEGTGNKVNLGSNIRLTNYDLAMVGFPAIEALAGNIVKINGFPSISTDVGVGGKYSATGSILVDEWRSYTPTVYSGAGTLNSASALGAFKAWNDSCYYKITVTVVDKGTGASDIRATLPINSSNDALSSIGFGRNNTIGGIPLVSVIPSNSNIAVIYNYDNSFPGADASELSVNGEYRI